MIEGSSEVGRCVGEGYQKKARGGALPKSGRSDAQGNSQRGEMKLYRRKKYGCGREEWQVNLGRSDITSLILVISIPERERERELEPHYILCISPYRLLDKLMNKTT